MTMVPKEENTQKTQSGVGKQHIVEKRVQPTVIRRRKKEATVEPVVAKASQEVLVVTAQPEIPKARVPSTTRIEKPEKLKKAELESAPIPALPKKAADKAPAKVEIKKLDKVEKEKIEALLKKEREEKELKAKKKLKVKVEKEEKQLHLEDFKRKVKILHPKERKVVNIRQPQKTQITTPSAHKRIVKIKDHITIGDLAKSLSVKSNELISRLLKQGLAMKLNDTIDFDAASLIATDFGFELVNESFKEQEVEAKLHENKTENLQPRPPIVTIMGHVDHGKTTLLDVIRQTNVVASEAGGITQHIGAYQVDVNGRKITFIDTPGHAAFTQMRSRGAKVTDIVILVVAADDGVMPQTKEAVAHAKEAGVSLIVAVNKIDKSGANPEKIKQQLSELELVPEEWGGQTIFMSVSALKKQGIKELLDIILLQADVLELKANPDKLARGIVLEAKLDPGQGPVVTLLVKEGTLKVADHIVCGAFYGKIRGLRDEYGKPVSAASPSKPVEVMGLSGSPQAGESFFAVNDVSEAKEIVENRLLAHKQHALKQGQKKAFDDLLRKTSEISELKELKLIVKADVQGSLEALGPSLEKLSTDEVSVKIIQSMVGGINENDIHLSSASHAMIIGFNVRPDAKARKMAEEKVVAIKTYRIIYEAIDDVKALVKGMTTPKFEEEFLGRADIREVFHTSKSGTIAGCYVTEGKILRNAKVRLLRDSTVVHEGDIASLKRFKDDAREVQSGFECGVSIVQYNDVKVGDVIEAYRQKVIES
ncbi:MAG: translation initiation factor IF-2 [Deltaproteobacteria bacterium]|nr:translation initiation factor IF-2 [Deltaproteobacteria bacterium]